MVKDTSSLQSRRTVLKKGAVATSIATGGLTITSGSAAADQLALITIDGVGRFDGLVAADTLDVQSDGFDLDKEEPTPGTFALTGLVDAPNGPNPSDNSPTEYFYARAEGYQDDTLAEETDDEDVTISVNVH